MVNEDKIKSIKELLSAGFETNLFEAAIYNLNNKKNKLRFNNFAYSVRELLRNILSRLAPNDKVIKCDWFKPVTKDKKPSRKQRLKYAIQGGINDDILNHFGFDVKELNKEITSIRKTIDTLSKYTHINSETFSMVKADVDKLSAEVIDKFESFVSNIRHCRNQLIEFLDEKIDGDMMDSLVYNFFQNVDLIAPHHSSDCCELADYSISEINESEIVVDVEGYVDFTLYYGSGAQRRDGDGLDLSQSFPFNTRVHYAIGDEFPSDDYYIEEFDVDTESWYE